MPDSRPIGVFDSGVGGLTVARAVLDLLPYEPVVYVGDTARFPYGPKPLPEIRTYALEIADYLLSRDVKVLVVACNSIEVAAIEEVTDAAVLPVVGEIEAGATSSDRLLAAARTYLSPLRDQRVDTLILGCTHYPMLSGLIQMVMGEDVVLVSSAEETAKDVYATLRSLDLLIGRRADPPHEFLCTGDPGQFQSVAHHFLGPGVGRIDAVAVQPVGGGP